MNFVIAAEPGRVLEGVVERARSLGKQAVVVFDLDSTLFDNRPRQVLILREFGKSRGVKALAANEASHWTSGWDLRGAMVSSGLSEQETDKLFNDAKEFWRKRFFTSEYCEHDIEVAGAPAFLHDVEATGAVVAYVTGRHEEMRAGTVSALKRCAFPVPDGQVRLIMKPTLYENDDAFKARAHAQIRELGTVVAAFDNEPSHANLYRQQFPQATVVHLATDHSGRPVSLLEGIVSIADFRR